MGRDGVGALGRGPLRDAGMWGRKSVGTEDVPGCQ